MTKVMTAQGAEQVITDYVARGFVCAYYGIRCPEGWSICDGTLATPNMTDRVGLGDTAAGTGSSGGTASPVTGLVHTGFALADHSNHVVTQPAAHSAHSPTQPANHSNHVVTLPATHPTHSSDGGHTHNAHTTGATGSVAVTGTKLTGPGTHSTDGAHTHDAHPAHAGLSVNNHAAHSGFAVDAHSAHSAFAVDTHSVHSVGQPTTHIFQHLQLAFIMKL